MMKNKIKKSVALIGALLMASMGVACGGNTDTGEDCLDVYCHKAGYGVAWCEDLLKEFVKQDWVKAKYPNVTYTFQSTDQDGYTKSKLEATNNNHFDLLFGFNGDKPADESLLEDLTQGVYKQQVPGEEITYENKVFSSYNEVNKYIDVSNLEAANKYYTTSWAGGMNGIFYNEDLLTALDCSVPRTTDELLAICNKIYENRTDGVAKDDAYEGYAFIQSKGLAYWLYMFPQWWAQYEGVSGYNDYWNGKYYGEQSKEIFKQQGRLESLKLFETFLEYDKHLDPNSMGESYTYKIAQGMFLRGQGVFHVNGDWFENEMKDKKAEIKEKENLDYSIKLMRTPIISALGTKLGITDAQLADTVDYVDGVTTTKPDVSDTVIAAVREARGVVHSIGANHTSYVPSYAREKDIAQDFLLFMATDKAQEIYMTATGGSSLPFKYDVKTKNPTLYASLTAMQKERVDYFNSATVEVKVLAAKEAFPLARYGGLSEFSCGDDYVTILSMNNPSKSAQDIYNDTLTYWGFNLDGTSNDNQRWNTALSKAGLGS